MVSRAASIPSQSEPLTPRKMHEVVVANSMIKTMHEPAKRVKMNFETESKLAIAVPGYVEHIFNM